MTITLILLVFVLLVFTIGNFVTLQRLSKSKNQSPDKADDSRYFELKYRVEFIVSIFSVVVGVMAFLGYNSITNAKNEIKSGMEKEVSDIKDEFSRVRTNVDTLNALRANLELKYRVISKGAATSETIIQDHLSRLTLMQKQIDAINSKKIVQQNFIVTKSLTFRQTEKNPDNVVYFKDIQTLTGERLPNFSSPPLVIPVSEGDKVIDVLNVDSNSFQVFYGSSTGKDPDMNKMEFSLVIIGK